MSNKKPLRYFYLNGNLHRKLQINRGRDTIVTWCYPLGKRVAYTYSDMRKNHEPAFSTKQVAELLGRGKDSLDKALQRGDIEPPQFTYSLTPERIKMKYMWSEADIMRAHDYYSSVHYGRPRKDGMITPYRMPTKREIRALIHQEAVLYVRNDDGEFVPTWKAQEF